MAKKPEDRKSGPKGGRPFGSLSRVRVEVMQAAQRYTPECIEFLASVVRDTASKRRWVEVPDPAKPGKTKRKQRRVPIDCTITERITAANALLDRGHGKPRQAVDHTIKTLDLSRLTDAELDLVERLALRAADGGEGADGTQAPAGTGGTGDNGTQH